MSGPDGLEERTAFYEERFREDDLGDLEERDYFDDLRETARLEQADDLCDTLRDLMSPL